jgi:hypothetical protein
MRLSDSSVLPDESLSMALRSGKQKENAGAERGVTSGNERRGNKRVNQIKPSLQGRASLGAR